MAKFNCLIKSPSGYLSWTEVEAVNIEDARAQAKAVNAGEVMSVASGHSNYEGDIYSKSSRSSSSSSDGDAIMGFFAMLAVGAAIYIAVFAWPFLLAMGAIYLAYKLLTA